MCKRMRQPLHYNLDVTRLRGFEDGKTPLIRMWTFKASRGGLLTPGDSLVEFGLSVNAGSQCIESAPAFRS